MADFDPQQSSENEAGNQPDQFGESRPRQQRPVHPWDAQEANSHCGCGSDGESCDLGSGNRPDSFVADWSGAEKSLSEQASSFESRNAEMASEMTTPADEGLSSEFWGDLANAQRRAADAAASRPQQSGQLWDDLVRSQNPESDATPYAEEVGDSSSHYSVNSQPRGMGWSQDEASEWAPPRDERVEAAGEPLDYETPALSRRDDFELSTPASAQDDWQSVRSEAMHAENKSHSLTDGAAEASQEKAKKARKTAAKKPVKKKAAAKKAKAKKPAKKAAGKKTAKKKTAKKTVKKESTQPPTPPTVQDPTRQAA